MSATKDPVRDLLNTEISKVLKHHGKLDGVLRADLVEAVLAAIQHSEQRETVTSDEVVYVCSLRDRECGNFERSWCDTCPKRAYVAASKQRETVPAGVVAWANVKDDGTICGLSQHPEDIARWLNPRPLVYAAPVAAPVPEEKAGHQSEVWCVESKTTKLLFDSENAARRFMSGLPPTVSGGMTISSVPVICNAPQPAAPAVKHEAPACNPMGGEMRAYKHEASDTMQSVGRFLDSSEGKATAHAARQSAPPIAVQGSEINQFRHVGCADWYDGVPDPADGGTYETRTLYLVERSD